MKINQGLAKQQAKKQRLGTNDACLFFKAPASLPWNPFLSGHSFAFQLIPLAAAADWLKQRLVAKNCTNVILPSVRDQLIDQNQTKKLPTAILSLLMKRLSHDFFFASMMKATPQELMHALLCPGHFRRRFYCRLVGDLAVGSAERSKVRLPQTFHQNLSYWVV